MPELAGVDDVAATPARAVGTSSTSAARGPPWRALARTPVVAMPTTAVPPEPRPARRRQDVAQGTQDIALVSLSDSQLRLWPAEIVTLGMFTLPAQSGMEGSAAFGA